MKILKNKSPAYLLCVLIAVVLAISLVGCGVDITSIGLPTSIVLEKGEAQQLEIQYGAKDEATEDKIKEAAAKLKLEWSSADETVATVDENGLVTAVGAGETDVTVTAASANVSSTTHIKVVILPTNVEAPESLELVTNGENTKALGAKIIPEDSTEVKLAYKSSDDNIATVDEEGYVTAIANGECVITVSVVFDLPATAETAESAVDSDMLVTPDALKAETKVTVVTKVESITLNSTEGTLTIGNTTTLKATVSPDDATNPTVTWKSGDEAVATVDESGTVTAKAKGTAEITATNADGDVSASYALTVKNVTCSYCGQEGHTKANCPTKAAADKKAAEQQAAAQAAAAQAAQQAAEQAAQAAQQAQQQQQAAQPSTDTSGSGGGSSGGSSGGGSSSNPNVVYGTIVDPNATQGSGIDWTQDNSNGSNDNCDGPYC